MTYPEPCVGALILNRNGEILLIKSHKWNNKYCLPGGHVELGETLHKAVLREVKEETGLDVHDINLIGFQEFIFDNAFWKKKHFIFFDFLCKTDSNSISLNDESQEYVWLEPQKALNSDVNPYTRETIRRYLK